MNPHDPIFIAPPITEVPDYVWAPQYGRTSYLPGKPVKKPEEEGRRISHPDVESALQAAKRSCRAKSGRWLGHSQSSNENTAFLVYEGGKVVERHEV